MNEIWKLIDDFPNYEVSTYGRVRSIDRDYVDSWGRLYHKTGQLLKLKIQSLPGVNYKQVMVCVRKDGKMYRLIVARLVAKTFIPNPDNLPQVNHKDENSLNNHVSNLEWCTCKYNINYGGTITRRAKSRCRPVDIYDKNMNYIETLPSGVETSKKYNVSRGNISSCCNGDISSVKGYCFRFHKDNN